MKFVFCDLETTGLNPEKNCIIEVAVLIVEPGSLEHVAAYESVVKPLLEWGEHANPVAMDMHRSSGLIDRACNSNKFVERVEEEMIEILPDDEDLYLAGSSVHFDRSFLSRHMPNFLAKLSHRQLDVTSVRLGIWGSLNQDPMTWEKARKHTAMDDLKETIAEYRHYVTNHLS